MHGYGDKGFVLQPDMVSAEEIIVTCYGYSMHDNCAVVYITCSCQYEYVFE